jgi:putative ABC transport system ATP-binding protein
MTELIRMRGLVREYAVGVEKIRALDGVDLSVERGEFVAIMGPSGSGKSTAMNMIGCLDKPDAGSYVIDGYEVADLSEDQLADLRNRKIGFVFQSFNLLPRASLLENVELPMLYAGVPARVRRSRALAALERVGIDPMRANSKPSELSGGQQQRVSIARALVNEPVLLLADEPTGALDSVTTETIMSLFEALHRQGNTIVIVTHEPDVGRRAQRIVRFRDGRIDSDGGYEPGGGGA